MSTTAIRALSRRAATTTTDADIEASSLGLYDCPEGRDEYTPRSSSPLVASALSALYDIGDVLHIFRRSHGCRFVNCEPCHDARMAWVVLQPLECGLEGEFSFANSPQLARLRDASVVRRGDRAQSAQRWRPTRGRNHPVHELAILALLDLGKALETLHKGHGCGVDDCYVCDMAEMGAYLVPMLTAALETTLVPTVALLRKHGVGPGRGKVLRLLEEFERCS